MRNRKNPHFRPPPPQQPPVHHHYNHQPHYSNYENTLIQEVLYLHSLWRNGPPSSHFTPPFKKPKPPSSDKPWPVPVPEPGSSSGSGSAWPAFPKSSKPITRPATVDERAKLIGIKTQLNAIESCSSQFNRGGEEDDEEEDEVDDGDDEDEREFFEDLFAADKELLRFYKGNCDGNGSGGEFYCLVCGLIGKSKKFRNCVGLVQHSMTVSRTGKRKCHRAYGSVVCKVLGWDVERLPSVDNAGCVMSEVKNSADEDTTVANMETSDVLVKPTQTETDSIPIELKTDNVASTDVGCRAVGNMETSVVLAKPTQTEREPIPSALEMENAAPLANTNAECITIVPTHVESEVKDSADEDTTFANMETSDVLVKPTKTETESIPAELKTDNVASTNVGCPAVGNMETSVVLAKPTQTEREPIPSALETENAAPLANTNAECITIVPTHVESEVKNSADEDTTVANMETSVVLTKPTQTETESIPGEPKMDNVASTNVGCPAVSNMETSVVLAKPTQTEREPIPSALETDNTAPLANTNVGRSETVPTHVELQPSLAENDPYEELPCLLGVFQMPE